MDKTVRSDGSVISSGIDPGNIIHINLYSKVLNMTKGGTDEKIKKQRVRGNKRINK